MVTMVFSVVAKMLLTHCCDFQMVANVDAKWLLLYPRWLLWCCYVDAIAFQVPFKVYRLALRLVAPLRVHSHCLYPDERKGYTKAFFS